MCWKTLKAMQLAVAWEKKLKLILLFFS